MRLARIRTDDGVATGRYEEGLVTVDGDEFEVGVDADLLAPCEPSAVYCVGRNYAATVDQMDYEIPDQPDWFIKPPASVLDPDASIVYPSWTDELTYAGELAAVIDRECHDISEAEVADVVRGYTILNDLDALDQPGRTARKAFDGSGPLGPWIETDVDPSDMDMTTHVGGELRQEANTDQMLFSPAEVVSFLSERYTFRPGDVVSFGSPANPGLLEPGDDVEIWYEGVGTLANTVVASEK
ncbi:fumarylacetoacetate hydrolase family protein [Haloferax larsenii]|uniref:2-keto-4-pentenoate hydratase/2-oxohepta-3-ene-1,7-dioic acid hydratase (Catechol pathway) n=1 Tax=Haloferax larsenii TaxID=302484 RepID=A0A1H7TKH4_HALLR|nr:fumarylacetoacetate hydrolase family protein [Haloferax larsenii]SEL85188.1 2-keto-4-pentenoate hydratase/2-oxohepta-3-ene-1,7-dioic acid hydratase (catechol pathway) [Haloferax larsenii]